MKPIFQTYLQYSTPICLITRKGKNNNNILITFMQMLDRRVADASLESNKI